MVHLSHIYKTYVADKHVLQNLDLKAQSGDFLFLMGPSGAGKTTLFRVMTGFEKATSGKVEINGFDLNKISRKEMAQFRQSIGVVFQDFKLLYDRSIFENVALPLLIKNKHKWEVLEKVESLLRRVGLGKRMGESPVHLSGGEKQRVAIARALVHQPKLIIADEPTGNLDWKMSEEIMDLFKDINKQIGATVIIATHDQDIVKNTKKKRIVKMNSGQLFESGEQQPCGQYFEPLKEAGLNIL